eukprot:PhF_6_TR17110/c0_g2_i7/m.26366
MMTNQPSLEILKDLLKISAFVETPLPFQQQLLHKLYASLESATLEDIQFISRYLKKSSKSSTTKDAPNTKIQFEFPLLNIAICDRIVALLGNTAQTSGNIEVLVLLKTVPMITPELFTCILRHLRDGCTSDQYTWIVSKAKELTETNWCEIIPPELFRQLADTLRQNDSLSFQELKTVVSWWCDFNTTATTTNNKPSLRPPSPPPEIYALLVAKFLQHPSFFVKLNEHEWSSILANFFFANLLRSSEVSSTTSDIVFSFLQVGLSKCTSMKLALFPTLVLDSFFNHSFLSHQQLPHNLTSMTAAAGFVCALQKYFLEPPPTAPTSTFVVGQQPNGVGKKQQPSTQQVQHQHNVTRLRTKEHILSLMTLTLTVTPANPQTAPYYQSLQTLLIQRGASTMDPKLFLPLLRALVPHRDSLKAEPLLTAIAQRFSTAYPGNGMSLSDLVTGLSLFASLKSQQSKLFLAYTQKLVTNASMLSPQEAVAVVSAFAQMSVYHHALYNTISRVISNSIALLTPSEALQTIQSYVKVDLRHVSIVPELTQKAVLGVDTLNASDVILLLSCMKVSSFDDIRTVLTAVANRVDMFSPSDCARILEICITLQQFPTRHDVDPQLQWMEPIVLRAFQNISDANSDTISHMFFAAPLVAWVRSSSTPSYFAFFHRTKQLRSQFTTTQLSIILDGIRHYQYTHSITNSLFLDILEDCDRNLGKVNVVDLAVILNACARSGCWHAGFLYRCTERALSLRAEFRLPELCMLLDAMNVVGFHSVRFLKEMTPRVTSVVGAASMEHLKVIVRSYRMLERDDLEESFRQAISNRVKVIRQSILESEETESLDFM